METSKWGYERPFCFECVYHCKGCDEDYVSSTSYQHDDCDQNSSEEDKKDNSDKEQK